MFSSFRCLPWIDKTIRYQSEKKQFQNRIRSAIEEEGEKKLTVESFRHTGDGKTGILSVPPDTRQMRVRLWGAGGGGGGCTTADDPLLFAVGGGGGGGAYAEGYFLEPLESSYEYYVAEGASGGIGGTGLNAETSWFAVKEGVFQVTAAGGQGGATSGPKENGRPCALGGSGGLANGPSAYINAGGSAGGVGESDAVAHNITAGVGGAAAFASGTTKQLNAIAGVNTIAGTLLNGVRGISFGGGGSGSLISMMETQIAIGGTGESGNLHVTFFRVS